MKRIFYIVLLRSVFAVHPNNEELLDISLFSALSYVTTYTTVFGFDFQKLPPENQILIWKLNNLRRLDPPRIYNPGSESVPEFQSNATYLIAAKKGKATLHVFYWLGINSSLEDRKIIAGYAVELVFVIQDIDREVPYYAILSRELEGYLSQSLKITLDNSIISSFPKNLANYIHCNLPLKCKNLYYINGNEVNARIKKVPVHRRYMQDTSCLVLEVQDVKHQLYPISIYCGLDASGKVLQVAINLGLLFRKSYDIRNNAGVLFIEDDGPMLNVFQNALNDHSSSSSEYPEIDDSADFLMGPEEFIAVRNDAVKVYEINAGTRHQSEMVEIEQPITYHSLEDEFGYDSEKSFLLHSASVAGILLSVYCLANKDQALNAVHILEDIVWTMPELVPVRVMIDCLMNIDFKINITDFENEDYVEDDADGHA